MNTSNILDYEDAKAMVNFLTSDSFNRLETLQDLVRFMCIESCVGGSVIRNYMDSKKATVIHVNAVKKPVPAVFGSGLQEAADLIEMKAEFSHLNIESICDTFFERESGHDVINDAVKCIKSIRGNTGLGLKYAKDMYDRLMFEVYGVRRGELAVFSESNERLFQVLLDEIKKRQYDLEVAAAKKNTGTVTLGELLRQKLAGLE